MLRHLPFIEHVDSCYAMLGIYGLADTGFVRDAVAAECHSNIEVVVIHEFDFEQLRRHREAGTLQNRKDRRADLYLVVCVEDGVTQES